MRSIFDELRRMQEEIDAMFNNFFSGTPMLASPGTEVDFYRHAPVDLYETDKEFISEIEMPGVDKKDIKVQITDDGIEVKAEKKVESEINDKKKGVYRAERYKSGYYRYFALPKNVDASRAKAEYKNGVLRITIPKLKLKEEKRKMIEVR